MKKAIITLIAIEVAQTAWMVWRDVDAKRRAVAADLANAEHMRTIEDYARRGTEANIRGADAYTAYWEAQQGNMLTEGLGTDKKKGKK